MGRKPCCEKSSGLKRGPWTIEEDHKLMNFILNNGIQCWRVIPKLAGLQRCGKSCRLRWINYLRPDLKRGALTEDEEDMIIQLHSRLGNRWSKIAAHFPGRTDNEIKNHWNTRIKKKLKSMGVDPLTHRVIEQQDIPCNSNNKVNNSAAEVENKTNMLLPQAYQVAGAYENKPSISIINSALEKEIAGSATNLMMSHDRDFMDKLSLEYGGAEDFLESWIDSPFQWDAFNISEEDFL